MKDRGLTRTDLHGSNTLPEPGLDSCLGLETSRGRTAERADT